MNKTISIKEVIKQIDYLTISTSGITIWIQDYLEDSILFEYDDGSLFIELECENNDLLLPLLENGNLLINGLELIPHRSIKIQLQLGN